MGLVDIKKMTLIAGEACAWPAASSSMAWDVVVVGEGLVGEGDVSSQEMPTASRDVSHGVHGMCGAPGAAVGEGVWCPSSLLQNPSPSLHVGNGVETRRSFQEEHLWSGGSVFPLPRGKTEPGGKFVFLNLFFFSCLF